MRRLLPQSAYARNVLTLMTGTTLAQAIPIAISPLLTRLYSPEEFGRFALYMAVAMIASVMVTGRYELAILLPRQDKDALHIAALAMALSIAISALLLLVVLFFAHPIAALLGDVALAPWLYAAADHWGSPAGGCRAPPVFSPAPRRSALPSDRRARSGRQRGH